MKGVSSKGDVVNGKRWKKEEKKKRKNFREQEREMVVYKDR